MEPKRTHTQKDALFLTTKCKENNFHVLSLVHRFLLIVIFNDQNNRFDTLEMKLKQRKLRLFLS